MPIKGSHAYDELHKRARDTVSRARRYYRQIVNGDEYTNSTQVEIECVALTMALLDGEGGGA